MPPINNDDDADDRGPVTTPVAGLPSLDTPFPTDTHLAQELREMDRQIDIWLQRRPLIHEHVDEATALMHFIWHADDLRHELSADTPLMPGSHHDFLVEMVRAGYLDLLGEDDEDDAEDSDDC